jgi:acyl-CoA synthetase (AMP-forming)/AMP-acid ligase II
MGIAMLLEMAESAFGDRPAIGSRDGDGYTVERLARLARGGAALIQRSGAERVAFVGLNGPVFPALLFAAGLAGTPISPLNYRLSADQLAGQLSELGDPCLVADSEFAGMLTGLGRAVVSSQDWLAGAAEAPAAAPADVDDEAPAVVLFTSGTTSKPKRVVLRHSHLISYVLQTVEFGAAAPQDAILVSVPAYHIAGVGTVLTNLYAGRRLVYLPSFSARAWLDIVRRERVTHAMLVPTMLVRIVEELAGAPADTPLLRSLAYGGARMPATILEAALAAFPETGFVNAYGLTETSSTIAVLGPDDHRAAFGSADPASRSRLGSAGRPVPGIELEVRTPDGEVADVGEPGELWVRGPQVSGEYEGAGSVLDSAGWFPTRDLAFIDGDGYLFIVGRSDDTIIRGGENIAPAEIENVLEQHPKVRDVAVYGALDDHWGERIVAAVVLRPAASVTGEELTTFVRERLRGSRTPDEVVFLDELPYSPTGKLLRNRLRERRWLPGRTDRADAGRGR